MYSGAPYWAKEPIALTLTPQAILDKLRHVRGPGPLGADPTDNQHFYRFVQVMDPVMMGQTADAPMAQKRIHCMCSMLLGLIASCD